MVNWFIYPHIPDISSEVTSIMTSLLAFTVGFITFGLMTWVAVKMYTQTWKDTTKKQEKIDRRFLH